MKNWINGRFSSLIIALHCSKHCSISIISVGKIIYVYDYRWQWEGGLWLPGGWRIHAIGSCCSHGKQAHIYCKYHLEGLSPLLRMWRIYICTKENFYKVYKGTITGRLLTAAWKTGIYFGSIDPSSGLNFI